MANTRPERGRGRLPGDKPRALTLERLTLAQRVVYDTILDGRMLGPGQSKNHSAQINSQEALAIVERATERNLLQEELEFWTAWTNDEA